MVSEVGYASRTLSKSEQKWAQIEKELLAIVFACKRFHYFLYGRSFVVQSDHKPLETLVKRDIDDVTARLQRMFMYLLKYPLMEVVYKPGKEMLIADCLSRAQLPENKEIAELSGIIHSVIESVCLSKDNYDYYRSMLKQDGAYDRICDYVKNGWPGYHQLDKLGQQFCKYKSEMHYENGLLFRDHRLVIPTALQEKICKWLHAPHLGVEKTLARARMHYFWPNMSNQIKEIVSNCTVCETFKRNQQKEPLVQEEVPKYPYHIVAMDIFEYAGHDFIAVFDAYSNFLVAEQLKNKTATHVIKTISHVFDRIGYPTIIKSDNNPFNSYEFERFTSEANIQLKFSSPRYAQSNGLAEKGVAIAKNILKRCYEANETDKYRYRLMEYNSTPVASLKSTPANLFFGRNIKTKLPISEKLLKRSALKEEIVQENIKEKRNKQKYYYDRNAKTLSPLNLDDLVIFKKNGKEWNYGTIVGNVNDRSYIVKDNFDNCYRRNRRFIAKTKNNGFRASDVLFEENIVNNKLENADDQYREIQVVAPDNQQLNNMVENSNDQSNVDEPEPLADENGDVSSDEYQTASSEESEASSDSQNERNVNVPAAHEKVSRFGRIIRPPKRFGFD